VSCVKMSPMNDKNNSSLSRLFHEINRPFWISFVCEAILIIFTMVTYHWNNFGLVHFVLTPLVPLTAFLEFFFAAFYLIVLVPYLILKIVKRQ